jgi:hypothetical protein
LHSTWRSGSSICNVGPIIIWCSIGMTNYNSFRERRQLLRCNMNKKIVDIRVTAAGRFLSNSFRSRGACRVAVNEGLPHRS